MGSQTSVGQLAHQPLVPTAPGKEGLALMPHANCPVQLGKGLRILPAQVWRGPHPSPEWESKGHRGISSSLQQNAWGASKHTCSWALPPNIWFRGSPAEPEHLHSHRAPKWPKCPDPGSQWEHWLTGPGGFRDRGQASEDVAPAEADFRKETKAALRATQETL